MIVNCQCIIVKELEINQSLIQEITNYILLIFYAFYVINKYPNKNSIYNIFINHSDYRKRLKNKLDISYHTSKKKSIIVFSQKLLD